MLYFDKKFSKGLNGVNHAAQYTEVTQHRNGFNTMQGMLPTIRANAAAIIPQDVYREFDNQTIALMRSPNHTIMNDLMGLAKALPVGKIEHVVRKVSDNGNAKTSLAGLPVELDKAQYSYDSTIKIIHQDGFGRNWMEMEGQRSEGFDALVDDQANSVRTVQDSIASHIVNGVTGVEFKGYTPDGIKNSTKVQAVDLDASGLNINFSSASSTAANIRNGWIAMDDFMTITNKHTMPRDYYVSQEIYSNFKRYATTTSDTGRTILQTLLDIPGIASIKEDASLSGNEVIGMVRESRWIRPLVGMAVTTVPLFRANPMDSYNFMTWANVGLEINTDYAGTKGVLYARNIA